MLSGTESMKAVWLKSSVQSSRRTGYVVGTRKDLWNDNRCVLSLEWKREEVTDGVMVVTDDEQG